MRLVDADALFEKLFHAWGTEMDAGPANDFMQMINDAPTIAPPPNAPLTLDELRKMDGEPVWVCLPNGSYGGWMINYQGWCMNRFASTEMYGTYGKSWLAYRRKLEEGTT